MLQIVRCECECSHAEDLSARRSQLEGGVIPESSGDLRAAAGFYLWARAVFNTVGHSCMIRNPLFRRFEIKDNPLYQGGTKNMSAPPSRSEPPEPPSSGLCGFGSTPSTPKAKKPKPLKEKKEKPPKPPKPPKVKRPKPAAKASSCMPFSSPKKKPRKHKEVNISKPRESPQPSTSYQKPDRSESPERSRPSSRGTSPFPTPSRPTSRPTSPSPARSEAASSVATSVASSVSSVISNTVSSPKTEKKQPTKKPEKPKPKPRRKPKRRRPRRRIGFPAALCFACFLPRRPLVNKKLGKRQRRGHSEERKKELNELHKEQWLKQREAKEVLNLSKATLAKILIGG